MAERHWGDRIRVVASRVASWCGRVALALKSPTAESSSSAVNAASSIVFLASAAILLVRVAQGVSRTRRNRPPPFLAPDLQHPGAEEAHQRPGGLVRRLLDGIPLGVARDVVLQEVLFSWMLAEAFRIWLWIIVGMDNLFVAYWEKMAEIFPPPDALPLQEPSASALPLVLGGGMWRHAEAGETAAGLETPLPDLTFLPRFLQVALEPAFLKPLACFLFALSPFAVMRLLPPPPGPQEDDLQDLPVLFWVNFDPRARWEDTEIGNSGYFLERDPRRGISEEETDDPQASVSEDSASPSLSAESVRVESPPRPRRRLSRRSRTPSNRRRRAATPTIKLKPTKSS